MSLLSHERDWTVLKNDRNQEFFQMNLVFLFNYVSNREIKYTSKGTCQESKFINQKNKTIL